MSKRRRKGRSSRRVHLHKPRGVIDKRVEAGGPKHFGIVSVDCAKARSKWMLCDFYGKVHVPPSEVEHQQTGFRQALAQLDHAQQQHHIQDLLIAVERTGNYHLPVKRACAAAGYEVRVVHPFASKQFRQAADGSVKTDDNDLAGIHRATVVGFGLLEQPLPARYCQLQLLARHRRDLVRKNSRLREERIHFQHRSLVRVLAWAQRAAEGHPQTPPHVRMLADLEDDRRQKLRKIQALECEIAPLLADTPYVLLLVIAGLNVVSAADFAGGHRPKVGRGPLEHDANANAMSGRCGLYPGRYQSDQVDKKGKRIRSANKRLLAVTLQIASNLLKCNDDFAARLHPGQTAGLSVGTHDDMGSDRCQLEHGDGPTSGEPIPPRSRHTGREA